MSKPIRIMLASAEAVPFAKTGGLGDVAGTLPYALAAAGAQVSVVMPHYASIPAELLKGSRRIATLQVPMGVDVQECTVRQLARDGVTYFFVGNDNAFGRGEGLYGYDDDLWRFAMFSRAVCEMVSQVKRCACDVLHCNDWQTALIPVFLREFYQDSCAGVKTVFTIHNAMFQGKGPESALADVLGLSEAPLAGTACTADNGSVNMMKGALTYADALSTVSSTYVGELQTAQFGEGLDPVFRRRSNAFVGILNGIDQDIWNPATDGFIPANYSAGSLEGKAACKAALQEEMGLAVDATRPLVCMVTRLTDQKGVGMVCEALPQLMERGVQVAILGTGDAWFEGELARLAGENPGKLAVALRFDNALSHRMYAGADMLLMPSVFEPCGLSQMIAMRYGTLPVVRETGGLRDSVQPFNKFTGEGTGFSFANAVADEMAGILLSACEVFWTEPEAWAKLVDQAASADFSWKRAATDYMNMYEGLVAAGKK